jgi:hypothetical protein
MVLTKAVLRLPRVLLPFTSKQSRFGNKFDKIVVNYCGILRHLNLYIHK